MESSPPVVMRRRKTYWVPSSEGSFKSYLEKMFHLLQGQETWRPPSPGRASPLESVLFYTSVMCLGCSGCSASAAYCRERSLGEGRHTQQVVQQGDGGVSRGMREKMVTVMLHMVMRQMTPTILILKTWDHAKKEEDQHFLTMMRKILMRMRR